MVGFVIYYVLTSIFPYFPKSVYRMRKLHIWIFWNVVTSTRLISFFIALEIYNFAWHIQTMFLFINQHNKSFYSLRTFMFIFWGIFHYFISFSNITSRNIVHYQQIRKKNDLLTLKDAGGGAAARHFLLSWQVFQKFSQDRYEIIIFWDRKSKNQIFSIFSKKNL